MNETSSPPPSWYDPPVDDAPLHLCDGCGALDEPDCGCFFPAPHCSHPQRNPRPHLHPSVGPSDEDIPF